MRRTGRTLASMALVLMLSLSFLQAVAIAAVEPSPHGGQPIRPFPGFALKGPAPDALPVTVSLALPLRNVDSLSSLVKAVSDPSSPMFRHFITDQQAAEEFYPTAEFDSLTHYIAGTELKVQLTAMDSVIVLQGTVAQLRQSFGTGVDVYSNGTASYYMSTRPSFMGAFLLASNATALMAKPAVAGTGQRLANVTFTEGAFSAKLLQRVYNATGLYAQGVSGSGKTVGLLDWFGSPTVRSDLLSFDQRFGFPDSKLTITPIGPYAPNLGAYEGWSTEVALDVESAHAMAPGAGINLYVANNALSMAAALAKVVEDNKVNTLSQSFTLPEWLFSFFGSSIFDFNVLLPDQYYMLGSAKGITFTGSTGDSGGSGFTNGVEGNLGYPASSPYVTAVGGTQTYFSGGGFHQTAWSNIGFVPNFVNVGGSTGGVSILEPKPWYQSQQSAPAGFPNGRLNPDLSLQGGVDPATYIVDAGQVIGEGGTSESSPLLAGLVTLLDASLNGSVGLINPFVYGVANDPTTYRDAFTPIEFGYTVPWVAASGYNLVTGWGAPNIGEISRLYKAAGPQTGLNVTVSLSPGSDSSKLEFVPGARVDVTASVKVGSSPASGGSFTASFVTLVTSISVPLSYDGASGAWVGSFQMGNQSGIGYVSVQGESGGLTGTGFAPLFAGYLGTFITPVPTDPWSTVGGLQVAVQSTDLDGNAAPVGSIRMEIDSYSIADNTYTAVLGVGLGEVASVLFGTQYEATVNSSFPSGPATMVLLGSTYGYLPFFNGIYLQTSYIYPAVAAEPGSVAPGQELTIIAEPVAPFNLYFLSSQETGSFFGYDLAVGSNVTAELLNPSGRVVSNATLVYQACAEAVRVCGGGAKLLNGYLLVPPGSGAGLYTILLSAAYSSETLGETVNGSYYSQVWVAGNSITPSITLSPGPVHLGAVGTAPPGPAAQAASALAFYEGERAHVVARIAYSNGTAVKYGEYTAMIYPQGLSSQYTVLMHREYANSELVQLAYDPGSQSWVGNLSLPSPAGAGDLAAINDNSFFYSGPYEAYVTGISADGTPTTTALSAQRPFFIQPYVYVDGGTVDSLAQVSRLAFSGVTITSSGTLNGDLFLGANTISGANVTIVDSQIDGSLVLKGAQVTLVGVSGGSVTSMAGTLVLKDSTLESLDMRNGTVMALDSSYQRLSPPLPVIAVSGLAQPVSGAATFSVNVSGQQLQSRQVSATIDGRAVPLILAPTSDGISGTGALDAASMNDGVHTLVVRATQADGLSSTLSVSFSTDRQLRATNATIGSLTSAVKSLAASTSGLFNIVYALAAVALIAVVFAVVAGRRGPPRA